MSVINTLLYMCEQCYIILAMLSSVCVLQEQGKRRWYLYRKLHFWLSSKTPPKCTPAPIPRNLPSDPITIIRMRVISVISSLFATCRAPCKGMDEVVPSTVLPHVYTYLVRYGYKKTARQLKKEAEVSSPSLLQCSTLRQIVGRRSVL